MALTGSDAHNYVLASTSATTTADIAPAILTPTVTVESKTYDGTHAATITGCSLTGVIGADVVGCATARATATFTSPDAGDAIGVEVSGLGLTGWDAHNYVLASTSVTTTADIAPAILTPTVTVESKTYDGTHAATITGCSLAGVIGADVVGCSTARATATFTSPDAGDAIGVEVSGLGLTGWDANNYVLASTSATTTADIAPAILTPTLTVSSKTYDGTHVATITGCSLTGVIGADVVGCSTARATATFTSPDAGDAIGVEVSGLDADRPGCTQLRAREHRG